MTITETLLKESVAEFSQDAQLIEEAIANPDWTHAGGYGDWRGHVPCFLRNQWGSLSIEARLVLYYAAQQAADAMDVD